MVQRLSPADAPTPVSAEQVRALTVDALVRRFPLGVDGYRYADADLFNVVVAAAVQERSSESVCQQLVDAPSANLVRHDLTERLFEETDLDTLEADLNALLVERLPPGLLHQRRQVAIDLNRQPYSGKAGVEDDQLRRGEAKAGTTRFHADATACVLQAGQRVTLAVTFVSAHEALEDIVDALRQRLDRLGVRIRRLYLDREFATVAILRLLGGKPFASITALPKRGQRLKAVLRGRTSYQTTSTMESADDGTLTFARWVACRYAAGRHDRHGIEYLPFAVVGQTAGDLPVNRIANADRQRFGIESSYRQMNQVRARTTSRYPDVRLLLVGVARLLRNLWVWLKAQLLASTSLRLRPVARTWLDDAFRLDRFCDLLIEAMKARYHVQNALSFPFPLSTPLKL